MIWNQLCIFYFIYNRIEQNFEEKIDRRLAKILHFYTIYEVTQTSTLKEPKKKQQPSKIQKMNWVMEKMGWIMMNENDDHKINLGTFMWYQEVTGVVPIVVPPERASTIIIIQIENWSNHELGALFLVLRKGCEALSSRRNRTRETCVLQETRGRRQETSCERCNES